MTYAGYLYGRRDSDGNDIGGSVYDTRIVGTRTRETRRRLDEQDVLYHVVPDLRGIVRKLSLSGRVPKFTAAEGARLRCFLAESWSDTIQRVSAWVRSDTN